MQNKKDGKNYYAHFIIVLIVWAFILGYWTIKNAIDHPVELDNSFMMKYQKVNSDINKILAKAKAFDKKYDMRLLTTKIKEGDNLLKISLTDKEKNLAKNVTLQVLLTRPTTNKFNKITKAKIQDNLFIAHVSIKKPGRWNIVLKATDNKLQKFKTYKLSTLE